MSTLGQGPALSVRTRARMTRYARYSTAAAEFSYTPEGYTSNTPSLRLWNISEWMMTDFSFVSAWRVSYKLKEHTGRYKLHLVWQKRYIMKFKCFQKACVGKQPKQLFADRTTAPENNLTTAKRTFENSPTTKWLKTFFDYGERVSMPTAERGRHERLFHWRKKVRQRNGGAASRTLTPDVMREEECAKNVRQRTAARPQCNPDHGHTSVGTTTPTSVYFRTISTRQICLVHVRTYTFLNIGHLHFACR